MLTEKLWSMASVGAEWVLYVLLLLSFASIAIMMERLIFFFRYRVDLNAEKRKLNAALQTGGPDLAMKRFSGGDSPEIIVLQEGLRTAKGGANAVDEIATGARSEQKLRLERGLSFLGTLGNNSPFVGLFGTVLGIINAFRELGGAAMSSAGPKIMAAISEALVATAVGLLVAIPAVVAFNYFKGQVKRVLTQSDSLIHELKAHIHAEEALDPVFEKPIVVSPKQPTE